MEVIVAKEKIEKEKIEKEKIEKEKIEKVSKPIEKTKIEKAEKARHELHGICAEQTFFFGLCD